MAKLAKKRTWSIDSRTYHQVGTPHGSQSTRLEYTKDENQMGYL